MREQDPTRRFSATVDDYRRFRPSYPVALIDWILETSRTMRGERVLDVACGTGIVSALLRERGLDVVGLEPNEAMLDAARGTLPGLALVRARAEELAFRGGAFKLVTCGQAFHWFDRQLAAAELLRVLQPDCWGVAFWNERAKRGLAAEYDAVFREHSIDYVNLSRGEASLQPYREAFAGCELREAEFPYAQQFDLAGFLGRARSASYYTHGVSDSEALDRELVAAFERCADHGRASFDYATVALMFRGAR